MDDAIRQRFDRQDANFAELMGMLARHFERIDRRFDALEGRLDAVEQRLEAVEGRLDAVEQRLEAVEGRLDTMTVRLEDHTAVTDGRLRSLELRIELFEGRVAEALLVQARVVEGLREELAGVKERLDRVEAEIVRTSGRMDALSEDTRQRFRVVNDRLAGIERRLAA